MCHLIDLSLDAILTKWQRKDFFFVDYLTQTEWIQKKYFGKTDKYIIFLLIVVVKISALYISYKNLDKYCEVNRIIGVHNGIVERFS